MLVLFHFYFFPFHHPPQEDNKDNISVDESVPLWKGRLRWKQHIPSKQSGFGIKFYELCEHSSGHVCNLTVNTANYIIYGEKTSQGENI
jgi:hypothetical protein